MNMEKKQGKEVREWALQSKEGDKFHKNGMFITNLGQ